MLNIIKRSGEEVRFDKYKIINAIKKANASVPPSERATEADAEYVAASIEDIAKDQDFAMGVEDIQDLIVKLLMKQRLYELAMSYEVYRYKHALIRHANTTDDQILSLIETKNEELKQENSNKNPILATTQRDYMAGEVSKDISKRLLLPADVLEAHNEGIIHFHDMDYFAQKIHNCDLLNLEDMLQNGTVITNSLIEKPHRFTTACTVTTQIIAQVASSQYGGQSFSLAHLAPFVDLSRQEIRAEIEQENIRDGLCMTPEQIERRVESRVKKAIRNGIQTIQYQLVTLMTTNGQAPFVTMFMCIEEAAEGQTRADMALLIEEVFEQRLKGIKNEKGISVTPAFPKLIYVLDDYNIYPDSPYYYLTELAAKCSAKRLVPDYISAKKMRELKKGNVYTCMGCRSFLTVEDDVRNPDGSHKFYGRFNQGVVTINLPYIACLADGDEDAFWEYFDKYLEICHKGLRCRHERLLGTPSDIAPILWQHGALARLKKGETIDKLLYGGYSTLSLGYAGLYETVLRMTGKSHTDAEGKSFAIAVMQKMNDKCAEWRAAENIAYSVYGTPLESTTYKFAKALQKKFGRIEGITDHNYITNSYHVCVRENIDAFTKLSFESEFQALSPGGAISYVEVPNLQNNIPAVMAVLKHIYENIMYAELNTKSDFCEVCGYDGEIKVVQDDAGKLVWECPNCKNRDENTLYVARRTCGYIGTQFWNQGRTQEIKDRVLHLSGN